MKKNILSQSSQRSLNINACPTGFQKDRNAARGIACQRAFHAISAYSANYILTCSYARSPNTPFPRSARGLFFVCELGEREILK
jgi:hypothetical protein